jgi:predicted DNA binding CopG/RHH family protein
MLHFMQEEIANTSPQTANDFARLLAALAAAKPTELPAWNDDASPEDVTTLSYERALRRRARYKPGDMVPPHETRLGPSGLASQSETPQRSQVRGSLRQAAAAASTSERDRKCASVTIRMSQEECERLRERAVEAGMTISAYLRSCTFEAEALRAQVKQALTELRSAHSPEAKAAQEAGIQSAKAKDSEAGRNSTTHASAQVSRLGWLRRIIPDLHPARSLARA